MHIVSKPPSETPRPRMGDLACLPVFFTLKGKRVLVAGGSAAAAWKAELLAAAGAEVQVYSPHTPDEEMNALVTVGRVALHQHYWNEADWSGVALAVGDCEVHEARDFVDRAHREGVPVNVIDKPDFCQFQFGAIVNRSPLVVGISTTGAAPIFGQAVRRRIEMLLPNTLSAWAQIAQAIRTRVTDVLSAGAQRRAFWDRLAELAFRETPDERAPEDWIETARSVPQGRVTLVGAGPGDAEYLTIKAVRALQSADVILFDDLVSDEVLELARREAKRILVGKRARRESCRQEDINAMMVALARQGRHVVRLKSGDPMIFGRAGEEIAMLESNDITVDVVPGISTAFALAAQLRVSLTHRDCAQSVRFVTGHARDGKLPENLDWRALADPHTTHVFYMSRRTAGQIAAHMLEEGADPDTPILLAQNVGRADQQVCWGTLEGIEACAQSLSGNGPVITAVGRVFVDRARSSISRQDEAASLAASPQGAASMQDAGNLQVVADLGGAAHFDISVGGAA